jgi:hypothetical protein
MIWSFLRKKAVSPHGPGSESLSSPPVETPLLDPGDASCEVGPELDRVFRRRHMLYRMEKVQEMAGDNGALEADRLDIMSALRDAHGYCSADDIPQCRLFISSVMALARFLGFRNALDERVRWGKAALEIAEQLEDNLAIAELCASTISWPLLQLGNNEDAERYSLSGLEAAQRCKDSVVAARWAGNAARTLSGVARDRNDGDTAYYWAGQVAKYAAICQDQLLIRGAGLDFGYAALLREDFLEAESRFRALAEFEDNRKDKDIERIANRSGDLALAIMNQAIRAEDALDKIELCSQTRAIYERCLSLGQEINHRVVVAEAEAGLAIVARALDEDDEYERLIASCRRRFEELGINRESRAEQFIIFPAVKNE